MRRVIGMDIHRTFAEVVVWEDRRLRHHGWVDMTRSGLEGFGRSLRRTDEVVIEATRQCHGGGAGSVALCRPGDCRQPDAGEGDRPAKQRQLALKAGAPGEASTRSSSKPRHSSAGRAVQ